MIGSSPPDVTFWERVADSMCAENFTCRDTEGYIEVRAIFVQLLKGLPLNELRMYTGSLTLSAM